MTDRIRTDQPATPAAGSPAIGFGTALAIYFALAVVYFLPAFLPG